MNLEESGTLANYVTNVLREWILDHRLKPDEPILQDKIAQELGTSRIPVREALRQLENEGLVVIRSHSSARVAKLDLAECIETYKMREQIEPLALGESIMLLTAEQIDDVVTLAKSLDRPECTGSLWQQVDRNFHLATYAGVPTPRLFKMITGYWNTTQQYRRALHSTFSEDDYTNAKCEHTLIVDAIRSRNTHFAEEILRIHIMRARIRLTLNEKLFDL